MFLKRKTIYYINIVFKLCNYPLDQRTLNEILKAKKDNPLNSYLSNPKQVRTNFGFDK